MSTHQAKEIKYEYVIMQHFITQHRVLLLHVINITLSTHLRKNKMREEEGEKRVTPEFFNIEEKNSYSKIQSVTTTHLCHA